MWYPIGSASVRLPAGFGVRAAGMLAAVIVWWGAGQAALAARFIDYLYVEANEGDSSGGHAAIRFGNETFHFQHESPGILRVRRSESAAFHHAYAMLGNRSIRENRIAVSDETYILLRDAFIRLLLVQDAQIEIRDALRRDVNLFELLLRQRRGPQSTADEMLLTLGGLGYFLPDAPDLTDNAPVAVAGETGINAPSPALVSLRNRVRAAYGDRFIEERIGQERAKLRGLELRAAVRPVPEPSSDVYPPFESPVSTRYEDSLHALFALQLLQAAAPLRAGTFWMPDAATFKLEPFETAVLRKFAAQLEADLVRLVDSPRTDWGLPFVLGMARLAAIEASLASGRLVLLDIFTRDGQRPRRSDTTLRPYLPIMEREMRENFLRKRQALLAGESFREADYAAMERSGNLLLDIGRAMAKGSALRASPETPFPSREARLSVPLPGRMDKALLMGELAAAQAAERDYAAALERLYPYDLFRRNCVTEIFAVINRAIARSPALEGAGDLAAAARDERVRMESAKRLGGFVDASRGFTFIPFVSAKNVESSYAVVASRNSPSYRVARLGEMERHEAPITVFLRESNTITSTAYRPGPDDSAFLFFTDDVVLLRPLFGAFNMIAGLGESLAGLLTMPLDGSDRFLSGAKGILFSFPELVFVNLRKGSTAYVEESPESSAVDPAFPSPAAQSAAN
jgi:hypothetical protein